MASVWISKKTARDGSARYRVGFQIGGRGSRSRYGGSFRTRAEANVRRAWIAGELAAMRLPDFELLVEAPAAPLLREVAGDWRASRIDVSDDTAAFYATKLNPALDVLGDRRVDTIDVDDVAALVQRMHGAGKKGATIKKTLLVLGMVLDYAGIAPNPAKDRVKVRLPRDERVEKVPPTASHVEGAFRLIPRKHRLALLFLEWSGARVAAIDKTVVGDYDEPNARVRLSAAATKQRRGVWVDLHPALDAAIKATLPPREDRDLEAPLFAESKSTTLRTSVAKACRALGIPVFSPHDLRHRRVSLLHRQGMDWARIAEFVGHTDLKTTANTYTHVIADDTEVAYGDLLAEAA